MKTRTTLLAAFAVVVAIVGAWFSAGASVSAHQPDVYQIDQSNAPDPPCTFYHDDACEIAATPGSLTISESNWAGQSHGLDTQLSAAQAHFQNLTGFAELKGQVNDHIVPSVTRLLVASGGTDTSSGDVSYAITSDITGLPWIAEAEYQVLP